MILLLLQWISHGTLKLVSKTERMEHNNLTLISLRLNSNLRNVSYFTTELFLSKNLLYQEMKMMMILKMMKLKMKQLLSVLF
jgi:hypothetical protein